MNDHDAPGAAATAADALARLSDLRSPLRFVGHFGALDTYERRGVAVALPGIWSGMPGDLLRMIRARRRASVTGQCPECGECAINADRGGYEHEGGCVVTNEHIEPILRAWVRNVGRFGRGRRLTEDPETGTEQP